MKVAIYARVSTSVQNGDMQLTELRAYVAKKYPGAEVEEFFDHAVSGMRTSRPRLDGMLAQVRKRRVQHVVVWKLDRLGRSLLHLVECIDLFREHDVGFTSLRDAGIDTSSAAGSLLFHLLAAFAQFERDMIRERTYAGLQAARARGTRLGRPERKIANLDVAGDLVAQGVPMREVARRCGIPITTLRSRFVPKNTPIPTTPQ